jgi:pyruvate dehydrogenase E2 component (dihydrolipoamide acetyltransferase)
MAVPITIPRLGWTMEEGIFVQWLKHEGEEVQAGDRLYVLEGEKAAQDVESLDAGVLRIPPNAPQPGETVRVGAILGYLLAPNEVAPWEVTTSAEPSRAHQPPAVAVSTASPLAVAAAPHASAREPTRPSLKHRASPRARRVARELGIKWHDLRGSGASGRVRERDVRAAAADKPSAGDGRLVALTPLRKTIADRIAASAHTTAPVTLTTRVDATHLVQLRAQFKAAGAAAVPSYTDFFLKLTALALKQHPVMNAVWREERVFLSERVHLGMAVDTEHGLLAPVVRDVQALSLHQIAEQTRSLIDQARGRRLTAGQMEGGTFTVTNLGMYGIDAFTPIIPLPQCAILGVGRIAEEPAVKDGRIVVQPQVTLSLTFDHRAIDGGPAARFLSTLRALLEQPAAWLAR